MKIAMLTGFFPKLSETFILNQVTGLLDIGHDVRIYAGNDPGEPEVSNLQSEYQLDDRTTYTNSLSTYYDALRETVALGARWPRALPELLNSLSMGREGGGRIANHRTFLAQGSPDFDVYHAHFGLVGRQWDFLRSERNGPGAKDTPFIVSFYGYDASSTLQSDPTAYDRLFKRCDAVTVLSEDMGSTLRDHGCPDHKIEIQPLAIDTKKFSFDERFLESDEVRLLSVARFVEKKGLKYAIDAVAELDCDYNISYTIAGDGPLRDSIERQIASRNLKDTVNLVGWKDQHEIRDLYHDSHLFIQPSVTAENGDQEGTPTVLLEAQATGMPVVSTYHAGIPEIVADGESGLLVPERDVDALADSLNRLITSPERWKTMGRAGRQLVSSTHSLPKMQERLETIYGKYANENST